MIQAKNEKELPFTIPEYYLLRTYERADLLQKNLYTLDGKSLTVIQPGASNPDNGPDYRQAIIQLDSLQMRGDIEFHVEWQDWYRHGHDKDQRYNQVVLHVLWCEPHQLPAELAGRFAHLILSRFLACSVGRWRQVMQAMDRDTARMKRGVSHQHFRVKQLEILAWERFRRKSEEMRYWVDMFDWETALFLGLARALGYSKNSEPFTQLVKSLPPAKLLGSVHPLQRSPLLFWILLAWQGGLLDRPCRKNIPDSTAGFYQQAIHLKRQFAFIFSRHRPNLCNWNFSRLRPLNNPYIRLAGYSQILFEYQNSSLFRELLNLFSQRLPLPALLEAVEQKLCLTLPAEFHRVFSDLLGFHALPRHSMGQNRCRLFLLNIGLPLFYLWSEVNRHPGFARYLEDLYFNFPAADHHSILPGSFSLDVPTEMDKAYIRQGILEYRFAYQTGRSGVLEKEFDKDAGNA